MTLPLVAIWATASNSRHPKQAALAEYIEENMLSPCPTFYNFEVFSSDGQTFTLEFDFDHRDENFDLIQTLRYRARFAPCWQGISMDLFAIRQEDEDLAHAYVFDALYYHMTQQARVVVTGTGDSDIRAEFVR